MAHSQAQEPEDLPPEEIPEDDPRPEAKARTAGRSADGSGSERARKRRDDPDGKGPARRKKRGPKVPYPPSPEGVPEDLTDYPAAYVRQQNLLLSGLFLFLMFYIGAVLFFALVGFWCVWSLGHWLPVKVVGIVVSGVFFLYLVKGFFKRHPVDKELHIEITADEQPVLFAFIDQLCDELDAPKPNRVFVSPDVNAAVMPRATLINLFVEPKKDLLIGLGLVNCMNLTEFKSVLAHEFGHFSQSATSSSYAYVASRIIGDLISGEDWFDRAVNWCRRQNNVLSVLGLGVGGVLWVGRTVLWQIFKVITLQRMAVMREAEFHADLVAVKAAGSDAVALSLFRLKFGNLCLMQAVQDLAVARDHKLHSRDMFLHQDRAAAVVRLKRKNPDLGLPPALDHPMAGKTVQLFDPADGDDTDDVPEMRRTHPPAHELEANAKRTYVPAVADHRSPWILFADADDLRERMTYKFYRMVFKVPKNTELVSAAEVQTFIDNEHSETTYDPKYKECYDDRPLEPGDLNELNGLVRDKPWAEERMEKVLEKLYDGCEQNVETRNEIHKELESLHSSATGRPSPKLKRRIEDAERKRDENWEWFKSFDRRVYLLHVQMAAQVAPELKDELVERYRFQLEVQRLYMESRHAYDEAERHLAVLSHLQQQHGDQVSSEFVGEVLRVLRASWKSLRNIIRDAKELNLPAMKNFEEGENLADFILEGKMVPEPPLSYVKGTWIAKLKQQLQSARSKCFRLHFKSVGGILRMQEEIAAKWKAEREPISAEVIGTSTSETVPAEVIEAEVIDAEIIDAEVIDAEVIEADVLPDAPPAPQAAAAAVPALGHFSPAEPVPRIEQPSGPVEPELSARAAPAVVVAAERPVGPPVAAADVFALDRTPEPAPEPPPAPTIEGGPTPGANEPVTGAAPVPASHGHETDEFVSAVEVIGEATPKPAAPALSGITELPTPHASEPAVVNGSLDAGTDLGFPAALATPGLKPANGKRPAIRITTVLPGDRSPLAK
ncbi:M48 family metallopeptidase [Gemmata sp. JC717]|uniref:M48 family metallopeptidase n=1 Tax=Gemmata algarum TaxID=2975278 RepID=UPI0021BB067A|nr:M48 family metallopeptidase [Gemmata algarum]MDY3551595.1 M48 family metallopeptidase [Gemmata algarum]